MSLPPEGPLFALSDVEIAHLRHPPHTQSELEIIHRVSGHKKILENKKKIYEDFDSFGQIRCREFWELYRPEFLKILEETWELTSEGQHLRSYELSLKIYTRINDTCHTFLNGVSFKLPFSIHTKKSQPTSTLVSTPIGKPTSIVL